MVLNVHRNHKAYYGRTWRREEGGMEVGEEADYTPVATLSPPLCLCITVCFSAQGRDGITFSSASDFVIPLL